MPSVVLGTGDTEIIKISSRYSESSLAGGVGVEGRCGKKHIFVKKKKCSK